MKRLLTLKEKKTKEQIERMFKGCKVKTIQVITDTCRIPLEGILMFKEPFETEFHETEF